MTTWYLACALWFGWAICPLPGQAHEFYALDCCSDKDCAPYPTEQVAIELNGYRLHTGELIHFNDPRIRPSPDGRYHLCAVPGVPGENQIVFCLHVPPVGS